MSMVDQGERRGTLNEHSVWLEAYDGASKDKDQSDGVSQGSSGHTVSEMELVLIDVLLSTTSDIHRVPVGYCGKQGTRDIS
jgi:hypothetical protein